MKAGTVAHAQTAQEEKTPSALTVDPDPKEQREVSAPRVSAERDPSGKEASVAATADQAVETEMAAEKAQSGSVTRAKTSHVCAMTPSHPHQHPPRRAVSA